MKFIVKLLLIGIGSFFALKFFPWWMIVVIPFTINLIVKTKGSGSFFSSFLGIFLGWFIASYTLYSAGAQEFSNKIALIFSLSVGGLIFITITSAIMALVGALAGFSGNAFRNIFVKPKSKNKNKYGRPDYSQYSR